MDVSRAADQAPGRLVVDPPPDIPRPSSGHPLARLLPVAMVVAAVGMMALYVTSGQAGQRGPASGFFPVMMVMSLIGTLVYGARGTQRGGEIDRLRRDYLRYLDGIDRAAAGTACRQHTDSHRADPHPATLWAVVGTDRMWARRPGDADFGRVRIGVGARPLAVHLVGPDRDPAEDADPVTTQALRRLLRRRSSVDALPLTVSVIGTPLLGVAGDRSRCRALVRAAVCQLAVLHDPSDLTIAADIADSAAAEWDWLKWLPHFRPDADGTHVVTVRDGAPPADRTGSVLSVGGPGATVRVDADEMSLPDGDGGVIVGRADGVSLDEATACARRLARHRRNAATPTAAGRRPQTWPELIDIGDPARLDPVVAWRPRRAADHLRVPIGLSDDDTPVRLDLKEAAEGGMGPHGLCVGATGSGKSEFLRTLTLGLIASHPPEELNLVLVDFKGGATFLGMERAAHTSAVITNLAEEAHLVARMRDALAGEMHRRQQLLRSAGNAAGVRDYARLRTRRPELGPLPALVIVVDEFSELLTQHPEFAELFLAIGRVGRSLGMHLLLASQRLDEGRLRGLDTHLSYRVCLKTFSAAESRAVLGIPDAYGLPGTPGMAYLKTADGEVTRFRTAYVSGPPAVTGQRRPRPTVALFTARPPGPQSSPDETPPVPAAPERTVLDTVLDRVADHGTPAHQVWLAPLSGPPTLDTLLSRAPTDRTPPLTVPIGVVDAPFDQRRDLLMAELGGPAGNVAVVGGPRSGKSTTLCTLLLSLAATHDPRDVQLYGLDFGGGSLTAAGALPHVGAVAGRYDTDLVRRTVTELESLVRSRELRFRRDGFDSIADYRLQRGADDPFGEVFLFVDGWAALRAAFEHLEAPISALAAQGLAYGVHVVIAASRWADLRPALKDQLGTRVELRLGDPAESEMDRKRARHLLDRPPGHGITREGRDFVIALPRLDGAAESGDGGPGPAGAAATLHRRYAGRCAPPIAVLPAHVDRRDVAAGRRATPSPTSVVIGVGERETDGVELDFAAHPHLIVLGDVECGKTAALRSLCAELANTMPARAAQVLVVDFRRTLLGVVEGEHLAGYVMSQSGLDAALPTLIDRLTERMPGPEVTQQQLRARSWWSGPEIYVVVDDYDLVADGSGLGPLASWLPHARDVGLHLVVARRSGGAARAMFDPVLAKMRDLGAMGLMMSATPDEGVLLGTVRPCPLPPGRATLITRKHPAQLIQVAWCDPP
ncbi:type VII secretion protein EccCa [Mycolicibacterium sp. S2-37]|uniref:type VII secretion protein EccCa n=1 Tax=Mycolicibacterium sp. S2-37 TaxID=2810297 RepID=UPI001A950BB1|nr:type VII secretion protein EccCa [Mycolicibacterium sp. S2-37]MBO0678852.1 type VII secretion protein EccCa [Mycolicibacterium sp. S2-37]